MGVPCCPRCRAGSFGPAFAEVVSKRRIKVFNFKSRLWQMVPTLYAVADRNSLRCRICGQVFTKPEAVAAGKSLIYIGKRPQQSPADALNRKRVFIGFSNSTRELPSEPKPRKTTEILY